MLEEYRHPEGKNLPPHVFDIARRAYHKIVSVGTSQSVIICGESGSGKTECTKQILQFIAECAGSVINNDRNSDPIEQRLLSTNPILETFGNAKTIKNNNSSRFGKYIEMYFNADCRVIAGSNSIYLLEKIRVVNKSNDERNYHIFYQLLSSSATTKQMRKKYKLGRPSNYAYTQGTIECPGIDDSNDFAQLLHAFNDIGMSTIEQCNIFQFCAVLLWIGNILFDDTQEVEQGISKDECSVSEVSAFAMKTVGRLLGIKRSTLEKYLVCKELNMGGKQQTVVGLSANQAFENRDALVKFMYERLFYWIVHRMNKSLMVSDVSNEDFNSFRSIGVLDIFGFEILQHNSLEQLLVNFTNERLQQFFDSQMFRAEQKIYENEDLRDIAINIEYTNNQGLINLIDKKKTGILNILDSLMKVPQSNDDTFLIYLNKIHAGGHKKNSSSTIDSNIDVDELLLEDEMKQNGSKYYELYVKKSAHFVIKHYAGKVVYDARGFMDKNRDSVNNSYLHLIRIAKFEFVHHVISDSYLKQLLKRQQKSLVREYCLQLQNLMSTLQKTQPHYIRCIKPNSKKLPNVWHGSMVLKQLSYSGVSSVIKIRKSGYPFRKLHQEFNTRYKCVALLLLQKRKQSHSMFDSSLDARVVAQNIMQLLLPQTQQHLVRIGKSMILYRSEQHFFMEEQRSLAINSRVKLIQNSWRMWSAFMLRKRMLHIKPLLIEAIHEKSLDLLNSCISQSVNIGFGMKLIKEAKALRSILHEQQICTSNLEVLLSEDKIDVQKLSTALVECSSINFNSLYVQQARETLQMLNYRIKMRIFLKCGIKDYDIKQLRVGLEIASKYCKIDMDNDDDIKEATQILYLIETETQLVRDLKKAWKYGAYLKNGDIPTTEKLAMAVTNV